MTSWIEDTVDLKNAGTALIELAGIMVGRRGKAPGQTYRSDARRYIEQALAVLNRMDAEAGSQSGR